MKDVESLRSAACVLCCRYLHVGLKQRHGVDHNRVVSLLSGICNQLDYVTVMMLCHVGLKHPADQGLLLCTYEHGGVM